MENKTKGGQEKYVTQMNTLNTTS